MKRKLLKLTILILIILASFSGCNNRSKGKDDNKSNNIDVVVKNEENIKISDSIKEEVKVKALEEGRKKLQVKNQGKINFPKNLNEYKIKASLNVNEKILRGDESVIYINKTDKDLEEIYFHIYPNAYKTRETTPAQFGFNKTFPNGFSEGQIEVSEIMVNNKEADFEINGIDKTVLKVILNEKLKQDSNALISMKFKIKVPNAKDRIGWFDEGFNFGNWYPIAAVYDENGWHLDPYYSIGDPFYSDAANYIVDITVPKGYIVAATGEVKSEKIEGEEKTYTFTQCCVRDFAWVSNDKFTVKEGNIDGINLKCYSLSGDEKELLKQYEYVENSLITFNKYFGKYPYKTYSVVETNFLTGMEYPGIVFISYSDYYKSTGFYESIICHETAHQWWYGVVGDDEVNEAWLDESFARYSENVYYEMVYNNTLKNEYKMKITESIVNNMREKQVILKPVNEFNSSEYGLLVYDKGALMLHTIRNSIGDEKFFKIIQTYYDRYKFKNVCTDDFINVVEEITGKQWDDFFNKWLLAR